MVKDWRKGFEIVWHGAYHDGMNEVVRDDILKSLTRLKKPSDLITHTIFLSDDMDGPSVSVWGEEGDDRFHAEYIDQTKWESLSEINDDKE